MAACIDNGGGGGGGSPTKDQPVQEPALPVKVTEDIVRPKSFWFCFSQGCTTSETKPYSRRSCSGPLSITTRTRS